MADTVTVTVVKWHTRGGIVQPVNATYEAAPDEVENLVAQGFVTVGTPAPPAAATPRQYKTTEVPVPKKAVLTATPKSKKKKK
jgi:hypothetical protein